MIKRRRKIIGIPLYWPVIILAVLALFVVFLKGPSITLAEENKKSEDLALAIHLFQDGLYEMAIGGFESIIEKDPNTPEAFDSLYYIAESLFALEDWDAAVERYRDFRKKASNLEKKDRTMPHFAQTLIKAGDLAEAIDIYQEWLDADKDRAGAKEIRSHLMDLRQELAESLLKEGKCLEAREIFADLLDNLEKKEKRPVLEKGVADALFCLKQWPEAIEAYDKIRKEYSRDAMIGQVSFQIMLAHFAQKGWKSVLEEADKFFDSYPKSDLSPRVVYLKAWSLYSLGEFKKAVDLLFSRPDTAPILKWQKGYIWIKAEDARMRQDYTESIACLRKIIKETENIIEDTGEVKESPIPNPSSLKGESKRWGYSDETSMGFLLTNKNENRAGGSSDEKFYWPAHLRLADSLWRSGRFKEAVEIYGKISESEAPGNVKLLAKVGEAQGYFDNGWFGKAYDILSSIPIQGPDDLYQDRVLFLTAECLCRSKKWTEAQDVFQRLGINFPDSGYLEKTEWRLAQSRYEQCDFQRAIESMNLFVNNYPNSPLIPDAIYLIGLSYISLEEAGYAGKTFQRLLQLCPDGDWAAKAFFPTGMIHFQKGEYQKAIDAFSECIANSEDRKMMQNARFMVAMANLRREKFDFAKDGFERILEDADAGQQKDALMLLGWTWQLKGNYKKANEAFKRFTDKYNAPDDPGIRLSLLWNMAKNSYLLGNYKEAMDFIDLILCEAGEIPYRSPARLFASQCLLDRKDYKGFIETWGPFLDKNPRIGLDADRDFAEASDRFNKGEFQQAAKAYKLLSIKYAGRPEEVEALLCLGRIQSEQGFDKSALRTYNHLMSRCKINDCKMKAHQALGEILYKEKAYASAAGHFERVASADCAPDIKGEGVYFLGLNYGSQGRRKAALRRFREFLRNYKLDLVPIKDRMELGLFLEEEGEFSLAIEVFSKVFDPGADDEIKAEAQYWIGECYQKMGNPDRAILEYLKVTYLYPDAWIWGVTARFKSAEIYQEKGDMEKAISLYRKVEEQSKGTKYGRFAGKRIDEIEGMMKTKMGDKGGMMQ